LRKWAYARVYQNSRDRKAERPSWLHRYNWDRLHTGIDDQTPINRLGLPEDNVLRLDSQMMQFEEDRRPLFNAVPVHRRSCWGVAYFGPRIFRWLPIRNIPRILSIRAFILGLVTV
jgi:transposase InsO family protein